MLSEQLQATITDWIAHDPDEATAAELSSLYDEAKAANPDAIASLESRFAGPLEFGTAGPVSYTHLTLPTICSV